eukprot:SAG22_NODE_9421_length_590_cov_1.266802_1_plen_180_part_01
MWARAAYLIYIKDNMHQLFGLLEYQWVLMVMAPLAYLAVLDDVRFLAPTSVLGLGCAFGFGCIVVATAVGTLDRADLTAFWEAEPVVRPHTLPLALSICAFCNEGIVIITPTTRRSMRDPTQYTTAAAAVIVFFTACYMAVGVAGSLLFWDAAATGAVGSPGFLPAGIRSQLSLNFDTSA